MGTMNVSLPDALKAFVERIRSDGVRWAEVIKAAHISID